MKTRSQFSIRKRAFLGFIKAAATALLSVVIVSLLMNYASRLSYAAPINLKGPQYLDNSNNCITGMDDSEFQLKYAVISKKYFEDTKVALSKELVDHYCLTSHQVKDLMALFSFDSARVSFATYALPKVVDPENFAICKETFMILANGSVIDELVKEHQASLEK